PRLRARLRGRRPSTTQPLDSVRRSARAQSAPVRRRARRCAANRLYLTLRRARDTRRLLPAVHMARVLVPRRAAPTLQHVRVLPGRGGSEAGPSAIGPGRATGSVRPPARSAPAAATLVSPLRKPD